MWCVPTAIKHLKYLILPIVGVERTLAQATHEDAAAELQMAKNMALGKRMAKNMALGQRTAEVCKYLVKKFL
jgi:hypothetical protein